MTRSNTVAIKWADPLLLEQQITDDERAVRDAAHSYFQERLLPRVLEAFRNEHTDVAIFREMSELGLPGPTIPEQCSGAGMNYVCYGLVAREVERVDSGYRSMMSVQSSLVLVPINEFGNAAKREKYLPKLLARMKDEGMAAVEITSVMKRKSCGKALDVARLARDIRGRNGISDGFGVVRHLVNLALVNTYGGTHDIPALI